MALCALAAIWALRRRWKLAIVCSLGLVVHGAVVVAAYWPSRQEDASVGVARLRILSINVHSQNERTDLVLEVIKSTDADVVLLMEVNQRWLKALAPLSARYPHRVSKTREDNFGIALYSRLPLDQARVITLGEARVPSITADVLVGEAPIFLLGTHPLPPATAKLAAERNEQLARIAEHLRGAREPKLILGDLNVTPGSPYFSDFVSDTGLVDTSRGRGRFGTWPAGLPVGRIALDHCLVSPSLRVVDKRIGPQVGSDHLPIFVELELPAAKRSAEAR